MFKPIALTVLILAALIGFGRNFARLVRLVAQGRREDRTGRWGRRLVHVLVHVFGHRRMFDRGGIGLAHFLIFYGFVSVQLCAFEIFAKGYKSDFNYAFLGPLYPILMFLQDVMCLAVMVGLAYASYRRVVVKPPHLMLTTDAWTIIALTYGVVVTIYLLGVAEIALGERQGAASAMVVENALAGLVAGWNETALRGLKEAAWWAHVLVVLSFLNYLPYSKHLHLLGAVPNIFFARLERPAALPTPNLEDETVATFGASEPRHFTWKHLLDTTACTECGRCTSQCPAQATGKPLSPMKIVHDLKLALFDSAAEVLAPPPAEALATMGPARRLWHTLEGDLARRAQTFFAPETGERDDPPPLIGGRTTLEELWACTTCGACVQACPVLIEHVDDIVDMRRNLVLMQASFPEELQQTFTKLENEGNPWGLSAGARGDWMEKDGLRPLAEGETTPLLYWVGCAGACDPRAQRVRQAVIRILRAAGVEFAVLGGEETCTGDPARRAGNEYLYQTLARRNVETLNAHQITRIVTQCPHCFNTLAHEYPDLGGRYEVMHHSELIAELLAAGRLRLKPAHAEKLTFHDPCYLGRWNGRVRPPRVALDALPGRQRVEMPRSGRQSFCCGAGGARMWMEEHIGVKVNVERSREALATGASTIAVGCPFCMTMMEDGVKEHGRAEDVRVRDIAELVAEALEETPAPQEAAAVG